MFSALTLHEDSLFSGRLVFRPLQKVFAGPLGSLWPYRRLKFCTDDRCPPNPLKPRTISFTVNFPSDSSIQAVQETAANLWLLSQHSPVALETQWRPRKLYSRALLPLRFCLWYALLFLKVCPLALSCSHSCCACTCPLSLSDTFKSICTVWFHVCEKTCSVLLYLTRWSRAPPALLWMTRFRSFFVVAWSSTGIWRAHI